MSLVTGKWWIGFFLGLTILTFQWALGAAVADEVKSDSAIRLHLGIISKMLHGKDIKDIESATNIWLTWAVEDFNIQAATTLYNDLETIADDYLNGKLDVVAVSGLDYLKLVQMIGEKPRLGPAAVIDGKITMKHLLVGRMEAAGNRIADLKGKILALPKFNDVELLFVDTLLLRLEKTKAKNFFNTIVEKNNASRAVLDVFFNRSDVCAVPEYVYQTVIELNPQIGRKTKVLARSPELVSGVTCYPENINPRLKKIFESMVPKLKQTEKGRQMLTMYSIDDLTNAKQKDLDALRSLLAEYESLKAGIQ